MALTDNFGTGTAIATLQNLIDSTDFINALVPKLAAGADDAGLYTKKGVDDVFVKTTELKTKAAEKAVVDAIVGSTDFTGAVYTKTAADAEFVKTTELKTKAAEKAVVDAIVGSTDFTGAVYTKTAADAEFVKTTELKTKAAEKAVVDAIAGSTDFAKKVYIKSQEADEVYTKTAAEGAFVKVDGTNVSTQVDKGKALAAAILAAKDGDKLVLVDELGKALETKNADYGTSQTAQAFLGAKGLKGADGTNAPITECSTAAKFQAAVREVVSTPVFEIPADDTTAPLSWDF